MKKEVGIKQFLIKHADGNPVSFHMPGHKDGAIYLKYGYKDFLDHLVDYDITEIPGADNLFKAEGIILDTMKKYKKLYGVRKSYLLVNGTSGGLVSAILSTVNRGEKIAIARNSHKSIFNAIVLGGLNPVYIYPDEIEENHIVGQISPDAVRKAFEKNKGIKAVVIPSPNYYGICSDIEEVAKICHENDAILIVDQAHGAHLKFMHRFGGELGKDYPMAAEDSGADIVVNSTHKTLASFGQTAILNVCSDRIDLMALEDRLQQIESSSPSYMLMASLDINADLLLEHGKELMTMWAENIEYFYASAYSIPGLEMVLAEGLDGTKINIDMSAYGMVGLDLEKYLNRKGIFPELVSGNIVMCMTGIGNTREDYDKLLKALTEIVIANNMIRLTREEVESAMPAATPWTKKLKMKNVPVEKERVKIEEADGRVCAASLIPYPPGIPICCPGEVITKELIDYILELIANEECVIGIDEKHNIMVGK